MRGEQKKRNVTHPSSYEMGRKKTQRNKKEHNVATTHTAKRRVKEPHSTQASAYDKSTIAYVYKRQGNHREGGYECLVKDVKRIERLEQKKIEEWR